MCGLLVMKLIWSCTSMDYKYREFIEDGPITYLEKLDPQKIKVIGSRNRVQFVLPEMKDQRGSQVEVFWSNKQNHFTHPVDLSKETRFFIEDLDEASYIFELRILDDKGNASIPIMVNGNVYGDIWESYLLNRSLFRAEIENESLFVEYEENNDPTLIGSEFEWKQDGKILSSFVDSTQTEKTIENFKASSVRYRSFFIPEKESVDTFYSDWDYYVNAVDTAVLDYTKEDNSFELPDLNDGNWIGYKFEWEDLSTGIMKTQITNTSTITLTNYNGASVLISVLFQFDEVEVESTAVEYNTVEYNDLDRSKWYVAPETSLEGNPLADVSELPVSEKVKSPFLSHPLFYADTEPDSRISPWAHIDGDENTYLSMVKGYGTNLEENRNKEGVIHSWGGVSSDGEDVYFIIDLGEEQKFNYFRMIYRSGQANGNLKPQVISLFGSNDVESINDPEKWEIVEEGIVPPGHDLPSNNQDPNNLGRNTGNVILPESSYRYVKFRFDGWTEASQSMAISEFYLGLYN